MKNIISVKRKTTESTIAVDIDFSALSPDYRKKINTPYPFLNHMIEHIAYRAGITISAEIKFSDFILSHLAFEDLGLAFGKAIREYVIENRAVGAPGFGDGVGIIDEAYASSAISFEERAFFNFDSAVTVPRTVENTECEDLLTFLEGVSQGAFASIHINLSKGVNGHHIFEAIFRSFGTTLKNALKTDTTRAGLTSGVAGGIEWEIS